MSLERKQGTGDLFLSMPITNERYKKHAEMVEARDPENRNAVLDKVTELLDKYVAAYDQRMRYEGSRIASDDTVDRAYNGMLRREEERAQAVITRMLNSPDDHGRPGLGIVGVERSAVRKTLTRVAEAGDKREQVRREVLREISTLARGEG